MVSQGYEPLVGGRQSRRELPLECVEALLRLLSIPLKSLGLGVLSLAEYVDLLHFLPWESQKQVGVRAVVVSCGCERFSVRDGLADGDALIVAGWECAGCARGGGWAKEKRIELFFCVCGCQFRLVFRPVFFFLSPQGTQTVANSPATSAPHDTAHDGEKSL